MTHLPGFARNAVVTVDKGLDDGIRTVADENLSQQYSSRKEPVFEGFFFPD
jgi:hypothetical protein